MTAPEPIILSVGVEGMTCASCVNRIERFLRQTDGVAEASVNLATERATVRLDPALAGRAEVEAAIEAAGYDVRAEPAEAADALTLDAADPDAAARAREQRAARHQGRHLHRRGRGHHGRSCSGQAAWASTCTR